MDNWTELTRNAHNSVYLGGKGLHSEKLKGIFFRTQDLNNRLGERFGILWRDSPGGDYNERTGISPFKLR